MDVPEGQIGNSYLPERNEMQVSILLLGGSSFLVVLDRLGRLAVNEAHPTLSKQEKYTYHRMSTRLRRQLRDERHTIRVSFEIPIEDPLGHIDIDPVECNSRKDEMENQQAHVGYRPSKPFGF